METIMDINEIMKIIPHRPPFLLIDKIVEIEDGKKIVAVKNVTINEYFFTGHYPDYPVMPGVLIIEALAQTGSVVVMSMPENKGKKPLFGAVDKVKFRKQVFPGDTLILEVEIIKMKSMAGIGKGVAYVDGKKVTEAELTFMIV